MTRICITGGAGFIGANLVRHVLATTGHGVVVLDKFTYAARRENLAGLDKRRLRVIEGDIAAPGVAMDALAGVDAVVNCAAESHNDHSLHHPEEFVQSNLVGTFRLLEAARARSIRFHQVSTDEVYGDLPLDGADAFTEASPYRPSSPYSASKAGADHLVAAWGRSFGVAATVTVAGNTYGPYQHVEKFIPRQITNLLDGQAARLYGDGRHVRDWVHVADHCAAILAVLDRGTAGQTYAVGAGQQLSNRQVVQILAEVMGAADDVVHVADRPGHDRRYALDATKLRTELGWRPAYTDVATGLAATVAWYRDHEGWWRGPKAAVEENYRRHGQ